MKKLILLLATVMVAFSSYSQNTVAELKISPNVVTTDINGGAIEKDDTIQVALVFKNNIR
jgi:hypothetical protein